MTDEAEALPQDVGQNTMLREAMEAVRQGDRVRARDLLTRLLKVDQGNATYWVWLSAVVDSEKERLYCLKTALKLDPENAAAQRGAVLFGALPPDEAGARFPLNRPRKWEEDLALPKEKIERPRGWANPLVRLITLLGVSALVIGGFVAGYLFLVPQGARPGFYITATLQSTLTLSPTPSLTPVLRTATPTFLGATPLSYFLPEPYTPTPRYVITEHPILTNNSFEAGLRFMDDGQYETARVQFQLVLDNEDGAVDVLYYVGESYRLEGEFGRALDAYQDAINLDPGFAPAYLGRAMANLGYNPEAEVEADLDNAIANDPIYAEAYLGRGAYRIDRGNYRGAITDLETALELMPGSALGWMYLAQAQLGDNQPEEALASALEANRLDLTLVDDYLTLAQAYIASGETAQAVAVLQTYTIYAPDDVSAFLTLGTAYNAAGEYSAALEVLNKFIDRNPRDAEAYYQRGLSYLNLDSPNLAENDFKKAVGYNPFDFDAQLGLARAYFNQGMPGDAYVQAETNAMPLARSNETRAQVYYWEALFLEEIGDDLSEQGARNNWYKLIALPAEAMPAAWRAAAYEHLGITPTFTPTPRPTRTPTATPQP